MTRLLLAGIGSLVTNVSGRRGDLGLIADAVVAIDDARITWAGPAGDLPPESRDSDTLDVGGRAVLPGFVDAHTHLVFAGDRAGEFGARLGGGSYEEILEQGGGIHSTVAATRAAAFDDLLDQSAVRAGRMLAAGTTTAEVKSGYGLTTDDEVRMLEVAAAVGEQTGLGVVRTFLGAHVPDRGSSEQEHTSLVIEEMLPAAAPHAEFCDVFVDRGAFGVGSARRILQAAEALGFGLRLHAEQLSHTGAAALAAELGAASADHLDHITPDDARALAAAGVVAVLLPGAGLSMRVPQAPARLLWDAGVTVALATDCNPGTSYVERMTFIVALACLEMGLTPDEAVWAATRGGAAALRRDDLGVVRPGAPADLVVLDADSHHHIPYRPDADLVRNVIKGGRVVR